MGIEEKLLQVPQREKAGEGSDDAFAFQKDWVFYTLLRLQRLGEDYVFIFEYHDDVIHLDSEVPAKVTFIQVKKSERASWTVHRLLRIGANKNNSILGKLFLHCCEFEGENVYLKFVSDMHFSFTSLKNFVADEVLSGDQKTDVASRLRKELSNLKDVDLARLNFEQSELTFESHADQLVGAIERFIIDQFGPDVKVRAMALYDTLQRKGERSRRSSDRIQSFNDLKKSKGITKSEIDQLLDDLRSGVESRVSWEDLVPFIDTIVANHSDRLLHKGAYLTMENRRKVSPDNVILQFVGAISKALADLPSTDDAKEIIGFVFGKLEQSSPNLLPCFSAQERAVLTIVIYCEKLMMPSGERL